MLQVIPPPSEPRRRTWWPSAARLVLLALTWGAAAFVVLTTAAVTRIGPVLYQISERHGVHAFDIVVGVVMFCLALLATAAIVWPRRDWY